MTKHRILTTLLAVLACWSAMLAAPAKPYPFTHTQSDGTTVTLMMGGGDFNHSLMTIDGLTVAQNGNGDYCYMASGALSDVLAHNEDNRSLLEVAFIKAYRNQMTLDAIPRRMPRREEVNDKSQVPTTGSPRIPIILVNYTDVKFIDEFPQFTFQSQFNEMDKSCLHYFESQSRGKFSPQFDILGPVELPHDRAFYGANKRVNGTEVDTQLGTMIYDACTGLNGVDFTNYDNDGDGYVDVVVVLYAGVGEAQAWRLVPQSVWPCQWDMQESYDWGCSVIGPFEMNGVIIDRYAVFNELEGSNDNSTSIDGIGTFCHEFSHCLGLPDFYATNGANVYGMSTWSLMDHGCYLDNGYTPGGYTSYERHFMGWLDYIDPVEGTRYELSPLNTDDGTAVRVLNDANPDEYYLLEYRVRTGWDIFLPGEGILILHVDYNSAAWRNNGPNNDGRHPRMTIIPADNVLAAYNNSTDTWPLGAKDSLTNYSVPAAVTYAGGFMNKPITSMAIDQNRRIASLVYMPGPAHLDGDVNGDGEVNIADVNALIDAILNDDPIERADVNHDGEVNIADINTVIDIILSN